MKSIPEIHQYIDEDITALHDKLYKNLATKEDVVRLETTVAKTKSKLILWAFVFWVTQLAAMFAFLKFFIKYIFAFA